MSKALDEGEAFALKLFVHSLYVIERYRGNQRSHKRNYDDIKKVKILTNHV